MHLLRCLSFYAAYHRFSFESTHIPGIENVAADAISHNNLALFCSLFPHTQQVTIPQSAMSLLVTGLDNFVQELFDRALSASTRAVYQTGWRQYLGFCASIPCQPLPISEYKQSAFAAHLSRTCSWTTIRS